jgi:tetratricopeptide (TPR) repeat protein
MKKLDRAGRETSVVQAVTGTLGAGKTQLVAAYARAKAAAGWRLVAWVNAENTDSLLLGLAAVADAAGLSSESPRRDAADAARAVREELEADGERCLLVFDHVEAPEVVRPFLPATGAAQVLMTTTEQPVADLGTTIPVGAFSDQEAQAFLDGRTGLGEAGAAAVAAELGNLPLAVAQAAAVLDKQMMAYEPYLDRLRLEPVGAYLVPEHQQYPRGVAEAVLLSLDSVQASDRTGIYARIMSIMAVLSAAGVRRDLLVVAGLEGNKVDGGPRLVPDTVNRALERLVDRALLTVSVDGQTVTAHHLVLQVVREALARRGRLAAACQSAATVLLARAEALVRSPDRQAVRDMSQQVTALIDSIKRTRADTGEDLSKILLRLRFLALYYLIELGDSAPRAIEVGEPLTADLERVLGPGHPDTLTAQNNLAAAYRDAGRITEAIPLFEQILAGRERLLTAGHPDILTSRHNLAAAYRDAGRVTEAIPLLERTVAERERLLGPGHPSTVNSLSSLANAYRDAGRFTEAIPLFQWIVRARDQLLGPDHPSTLRTRNKLAGAYRRTGQVGQVIPLAEQILASRERTLGADDPRTLAARHNLATACREAGRPAEAIPLLEQNLAACERMLGAEDPRTDAARHNLAAANKEAGRAQDVTDRPEPADPKPVDPEAADPVSTDPAPGDPESVDQVGGDLQDDGS